MRRTMMKSRLAMTVATVGSMGLIASPAAAGEFDVTAEVQNALEVTQVEPMNLGTLFAVDAVENERATLVLSPEGDMADGDDTTGAPTLLSLGGQQAARGLVAASDEFTVTLPDAEGDLTDEAASVAATEGVEVRIEGGDPDVARLYLLEFRLGDVDGAEETQQGDPFEYIVDPEFGVEEVEFGIGATISTDDSGDRTEYQAGIYEGTFEVEASF